MSWPPTTPFVEVKAENSYAWLYSLVTQYLNAHFRRLPRTIAISYDERGGATPGLGWKTIVIWMKESGDAIGLRYEEEKPLDLDEVCSGQKRELKRLYGYHE